MDTIKSGWFSEISPLWPGICLSLEVEQILHSEKSDFQDVMVLQTKSNGKALILDGVIQCTESDEFSYQEMISFLPLCSHPCPKNVLIVGGGDGGVAREVSKHPDVQIIDQVEIDKSVIEVSKKYLPFMSVGFSSPKLNVHVADGFAFIEKCNQKYDVIITDSSDPIGPAESLFQHNYFKLLRQALRHGGIICSQASTLWTDKNTVLSTFNYCSKEFKSVAYGVVSVPTYPTGQIGFVLGSLNPETNFKVPLRKFSEEELEKMNCRYYSSDVHSSAFVLPRFARKLIETVHNSGDIG